MTMGKTSSSTTKEFIKEKYFNMKEKIEDVLRDASIIERITILESLCKKYRKISSKIINERQMGRRVDSERPDLLTLKSER